jgi:hypothetical protein
MKIRTTANIDRNIWGRICEAAELCGISTHQLVHVLFKIMIREKPLKFRFNRSVEYQPRRNLNQWKCFHMELSEAVYESCMDMRKLMKLSVSFLLNYAVEVYLDRAVAEIMDGSASDNYPDIYVIFTHHSPHKSTHTAFHTLPDQSDYPDHLRSSPCSPYKKLIPLPTPGQYSEHFSVSVIAV